ncbi:MAG: T9SS type A sorting domain-containing protein [Bacteroidales bacterium]|nr:T9SS type A sorting domain-containing protein [Bacteroidales bacterium]
MNHLHKLFICVVLGCVLAPAAKAQKVTLDNYQRLQVEFATGQLRVAEVSLNGQSYNTVSIDGYMASAEVGQPCLPTWSSLIEVPLCDGYDVVVSDAEYDTLDASTLGLRHQLLPLQPSRSKSDTRQHPTVVGKAYATDAYYGVALALVEPVGVARDRNLARLQYSPVSYNPVSGRLVVCRRATVEVRYLGADREATLEHFNRYHSPLFGGIPVLNSLYPKVVRTSAPVRYLIVAHSMFRGQLNDFVQWKRRKGFLVDIVYTDSPAVGTTTTSIQSYIRSQYTDATAANPAPTYLLLVGDHEQIPAFTGTTDNDHITDLYYTTWTSGDNIPDCYHGRFSAQNVSQLTPQVQKTLMYEQYTFADPSFLDRAVMVAGVDGGTTGDNGYTYGDPALDYAITNYINGAHGFSEVRYFKNNTSIVPAGVTNVYVASSSSSMSATVRSYYNQGAGLINYTAHGSATSWGTPEFTTSHAAAMTNTQKFGLMIGNCCLTNKFQTATCLGESVLRKNNYCGAVGYIGGSNSTYWGEDFYWAVGIRNSIGPSMSMAYDASHLGAYDRVMHTHGEAYSQWATSQGSLMFQGNMAVENSSSSLKLYYWEIYHLMGDPSVMTYLTQADTMNVAVTTTITAGTSILPVTAAPFAYVALVDTMANQLIDAAYADATGNVQLTLPSTLSVGSYRLAASAQQYQTAFVDILVIQPDGPYPIATPVLSAPLNAGETVALTLHFENLGNSTAHHVVAHLSVGNPMVTLPVDSLVLDSLAAGAVVGLSLPGGITIADNAPDNTLVNLTIGTTWTEDTLTSVSMTALRLNAPILDMTFSQDNVCMSPGGDISLTATLHNSGHATAAASQLTFTSPTSLFTVTCPATLPFSLAPGHDTAFTLSLHADNLLPQYITVPVHYNYRNLDGELPVYIGQSYAETFESGTMQLGGVSNNSAHPWVVVDTVAYEGTHSMRSAAGLSDNDSSVMHIAVNVTAADSVSFYYRVSSENNYDKFFFLIDGVEKFNASGDGDWTRASYLLTAGTHTLTFRYRKDYSWERGSDCVWIDNLVLPHQSRAAAFLNDTLCEGSYYAPFGQAINTQTPGNGTIQGTLNGQLTFIDYFVLTPLVVTDSVVACDSYLWNGQEYTEDGTYTQAYTNDYGCLDTVTVVLTLHHSIAVTVADTTTGGAYLWNGTEYTTSGEYQQVLTTVDGCDSTVTLLLTILGSEGVPDLSAYQRITVHPNPTTGSVQLSEQADEVRVYDLQGREVIRLKDVQQFDLGQLPQGVYTLRISTPQGTAALRLIRQ